MTRIEISVVVACALAAIASTSAAHASPEPAAPTIASAPKPKAPAERITFQLEDADLSELVKTMGDLTGKRFLVMTKKSIKATIYAPQKLTVEEAYRAFLSVLQANGLTVIADGATYKITESQDAVRATPIVTDAPPEERYVTRLQRLSHVSVDEIAQLLQKLQTRDGSVLTYAPGNLLILTDTGTNIRRMLQVVEEIDVGEKEDHLWLEPLYYASSADVEKKLSELLDLKKKADGGGDLRLARLVAFDRPNALAIVATEPSYRRLLDLLRKMDVPTTGEGQIHVVALQHSDAKKLVGPLNEVLAGGQPAAAAAGAGAAAAKTAVFEAAVKVTADETTNALLVSSSPRDFVAIKKVIERLDQPKRQVFIEAVVMDISAERGTDLGVAWHGADSLGKTPTDGLVYGGFRAGSSAMVPDATSLQAFALGIRGPEVPLPFAIPTGISSSITSIPSVGAFVTAMTTTRGADILSTPTITASDNIPAELKVQLNTSATPHAPAAPVIAGGVPFPSGASQASSMLKIGPRIKITPHMNDSEEVRLDVEETISDVQSVPDKSDVFGAVSFIERAATTTVTVKDGETMVIGGLVRNRLARSETKVPILGDIPVLGLLFRSSSEQMEKSNLVLVLTPHVIRNDVDKRRILEDAMRARQEMIDHAIVFSGNDWKPPVDYSRSRGIVEHVRQSQRKVLAARAAEAEPQADLDASLEHAPTAPLDLPVPIKTWGTNNGNSPTPTAPPPAAKQPAVRVER